MPPPGASLKRMTANPRKPARYRPGKAVPEQSSSEEEKEEEAVASGASEEDTKAPQPKATTQPKPRQPPPKATSFKNVDLQERKLAAEREELLRKAEERRAREKMEKEAGFVTESSGDEDQQEDDSDASKRILSSKPTKPTVAQSSDEDSSEDSDASSSAASGPKLLRPVFIRKNQRTDPIKSIATTSGTTSTPAPLSTHPTPAQASTTAARRLAETDALIQSQIDARVAARASAHRDWDADDTGLPDEEMVDDTDDIDPDTEHALWVARELSRLKRDRAALEKREAEIAEIERRRALATPEREAEDREKVAKQKEEKAGRGKLEYMARYHHKGAFYNEEGEAAGLANRDVMGARFVDQAGDKSGLPQYLQRRDETKIGRKGGTRYRDMRSEDTGSFGIDVGGGGRGKGGGGFGGPGRGGGFGQEWGIAYGRDDQRERTGANASALGEKRKIALTSDLLREEAKRTKVG